VLTLFIKIAFLQGLAGGTDKGVGFRIIGESLLVKDTLFGAGTVLASFSDVKWALMPRSWQAS